MLRALHAAQIVADLPLELGVDRLGEMMAQQDIFGGNGAVGLELEHPMAVRALEAHQRLGCRPNAFLKRVRVLDSDSVVV